MYILSCPKIHAPPLFTSFLLLYIIIIAIHQYSLYTHLLCFTFSLLVHSSQVETSAEEVKSKLFPEDNANCKVYTPVKYCFILIALPLNSHTQEVKITPIQLSIRHLSHRENIVGILLSIRKLINFVLWLIV